MVKIIQYTGLILFLFLGQVQAQDSTYVQDYQKIQNLLKQQDDSVKLTETDLFVLLGMALVCVKDTALEKQILADRFFSTLSQQVEQKLKNGELKKDDPRFLYLKYALNQHQYYMAVPVSDSEKLVQYVKEGRFEYIWHRIVGRGYIYYIVAFLVGSIALLITWKIKKRKKISS